MYRRAALSRIRRIRLKQDPGSAEKGSRGSGLPAPARGRRRRQRRPPEGRPAADPPARRRAATRLEGWPPLTDRQLEEVLATVTAHDSARRATFDQTGDLDLAYTPPGLPRLRVNGFRQRGAISFAFRVIPSERARLRRRSACLRGSSCWRTSRAASSSAPARPARASRRRSRRSSGTSTPRARATSSRSRIRSRSCTTTGSASSTSARSASTRPRSTRRSAARCARTPT